MAVVKGVKERVHLPIYDALRIKPREQVSDQLDGNVIKFFVDVQDKSRLETNLQSASLLPHYNTFEARALRVVISDLPPRFNDRDTPTNGDEEFDVIVDDDGDDLFVDGSGRDETEAAHDANDVVTAEVDLALIDLIGLLEEARASETGFAELDVDDDAVILHAETTADDAIDVDAVADAGALVYVSEGDLEGLISDFPDDLGPPRLQLSRNNGAGSLIGEFIYNTVTTLYVGEKVMVSMPTWFFPAGAGPYSDNPHVTTHGEPSPMATFRFAEPIHIDKQQNFRVEIEIPDSDVAGMVKRLYGPLFVWVVLDGYMTRDVQ